MTKAKPAQEATHPKPMNTDNLKKSGDSDSSTTVNESETATVAAVTVSEPKVQDRETSTVRHKKHQAESKEVNSAESESGFGALNEISTGNPRERLVKHEDPLTESQRAERDRLTEVVRKGFDGALFANEALRQIRDKRLWRDNHESYKDFCREELDLSEARVSQLLQYADEVANLKNKVHEDLIPKSERAIRELRRVKGDNKVAVLHLASKLSNGGPLTSALVSKARIEIEGIPQEPSKNTVINVHAALKAAGNVGVFLETCEVKALTVGEINEFRDAVKRISETAAEKLVGLKD